MLTWDQMEPRLLFTVIQTAAVTNERTLGITPGNPLQINPNLTLATFQVRVIAKTNITLGAVRLYGALGTPGAAAPIYFPPPGSSTEALWTTGTNIAANEGLIRNAIALESDAGTKQTIPILPNWLLLEYTTSAPGAGPSINFQVWASMIGPMIGGSQ